MIGTAINVVTVAAGAAIGKALGERLPERIRETVMHGIALITAVLGAEMALQTQNPLVVLGALVLGAITGELLGIESGIERIGAWAERRLVGKDGGGEIARGFVTTSILFCVGPMTLIGCLNDGLYGDYRLLATKALMDGISSVAFASALGWGVLLSAATVLVVQGSLTLGAQSLAPVLSDAAMRAEIVAAGGVMMLGLALRLLNLKAVRVSNMLPALLYAPLLVLLARWAGPILSTFTGGGLLQ